MRQSYRPIRHRLPAQLFLLLVLGSLAGCASHLRLDEPLGEEIRENGCINRCQATKSKCDADARYKYSQCQAGYGESWTDFRYCRASAAVPSECGYPWWGCSENLYGYCTNRYSECYENCRR